MRWLPEDLETLAQNDAREGAIDAAVLPLVQPARISLARAYAVEFAGRYLWRIVKEFAHNARRHGLPESTRAHCRSMRDAWVTYRLGVEAAENGGIVR